MAPAANSSTSFSLGVLMGRGIKHNTNRDQLKNKQTSRNNTWKRQARKKERKKEKERERKKDSKTERNKEKERERKKERQKERQKEIKKDR